MAHNLLEETLRAARRDVQTALPDGTEIGHEVDGMRLRRSVPIVDDRGELIEVFNTAWGFDEQPFEQVYAVTLRPGVVKGWALHKAHDDRYFLLQGTMQLVLYDVRPGSGTCGHLVKITLSDRARRLVSIPRNVWHADYNCGSEDVLLLNMPTARYDHENPDKYRLPIDTPLIPHEFPSARGY